MTDKRDESSAVQIYRADRAGYIGFGAIFTLMTGMAGIIVTKDTRLATALLVCLCIVAALFTFTWLRRFRIEITPDRLVYRSMFVNWSIDRPNIRSVRFSLEPLANRWGPTVRLTITTRTRQKLVMNAKVFSRDAIRSVLSLGAEDKNEGRLHRLLPRVK